ncbi:MULTISPECIES: carbohydrate ABC transporter permease [unclassified Mesotoga]|jgi:trehalose/maltose transport system permease protein|uniref:carbohydrate ABC transporter permease n=1 Tax=unclassified Mesotoga TaxID=1184398 RepID=UPI0025D0DFEB|nr:MULTISPECIES: sugar ABC transporter permease [unclassified Mesotoga]
MARKDKLSLAQKEQRTAYKLLIPALLILAAVAFYPLFQVFYTSLTDKVFASGKDEAPEFIGLENYKRLLGLTIQELPAVLDDSTGETLIDESTGRPVYERAIRVLPRSPIRYREWFQFSFFGRRYVVGARDPEFMKAIWNTLVFTVISVFLETILGLGVALVVNSNFKGKGIMRATMLVPWAVITVVSARIWEWMLQPTRAGLFNMVLSRLGLGDGDLSFLSMSGLQMPTLIAVDVWKTTPFMALLILAGLQLIPRELYEAGRVDGASRIRQFLSITMPLLKPTLAVALIFRTLDALRVFDVFQVLMGNRMYSMASYNYYQLIGNRNMGLASAIGVIIFFLIGIFAVIYMRLMGVDEE